MPQLYFVNLSGAKKLSPKESPNIYLTELEALVLIYQQFLKKP